MIIFYYLFWFFVILVLSFIPIMWIIESIQRAFRFHWKKKFQQKD